MLLEAFKKGHAAKKSAQETRRTNYITDTHAHQRDMQQQQQQKASVSSGKN
jgi:hypothetical protein